MGRPLGAQPNSFVGYLDAALREKILDILKAQSKPMVQPDGMADDLGGRRPLYSNSIGQLFSTGVNSIMPLTIS